MSAPRHHDGFTLLEVMVAIAILALSLSAIFSSQAGAIRVAHRARKMGLAALMARCKMGEIEEQVADEGLPAIDDTGTDGCCEDAEIEGFECDWSILPVTLPDAMFTPEEEEGADEEGEDAPPPPPVTGSPDDLANLSPEDMLSGAGGLDGATMGIISFVYPVLKPSFESQIRRATVVVKWHEGSQEHSFDVSQYLVANEGVELLEAVPEPGTEDQSATGQAPGAQGPQ